MCRKSLLTNLLFLAVYLLSYSLPDPYHLFFNQVGIFALSGALTNWLAIYMLWEKVPFLYGSGVIEHRFEFFKADIKRLVMEELFTQSVVERVILGSEEQARGAIAGVVQTLDYEALYDRLVQSILSSSLGGMLSMIGGASALEPMRSSIVQRLQDYFVEFSTSESFQQKLNYLIETQMSPNRLLTQVATIVEMRLAELTPQMVKTIIQRMIRDHLGWLVIWGGILGGVVGIFNVIIFGGMHGA